MKAYALLVGARATTHSARFNAERERLLQRVTRDHFPNGFTILRAQGGWWNPSSQKFEKEESREVRILYRSTSAALRWARALGQALQQKEVVLIEIGSARRVTLTPVRRKRKRAAK